MIENSSPLINALLACEIAGVGLGLQAEQGPTDAQQDFLLETTISDRVTLSVAFDAERLEFLVQSSSKPSEDEFSHATVLALSLNHPAAESDRFALDLEASAITFTRRLKSNDIELAEFAFAVHTATEVGLALAEARFPEILTEDKPSESVIGATEGIVRG